MELAQTRRRDMDEKRSFLKLGTEKPLKRLHNLETALFLDARRRSLSCRPCPPSFRRISIMRPSGTVRLVVTLLLALILGETELSKARTGRGEDRCLFLIIVVVIFLVDRLHLKPSSPSSCFVTPYRGLFVQEEDAAEDRATRDLDVEKGLLLRAGQHPDFGARVPWSFLLDLADGKLRNGRWKGR